MIESYNKTLRSYSESVAAYVRKALDETPTIISKRERAMGELAKKTEERKVTLPFASISFTGSVELDPTRYNFAHHFFGASEGFKDTSKKEIVKVKRYPLLLPMSIDLWGNDADVTFGMFSAFTLAQSFNPFLEVQDRETNTFYQTLFDIVSVTDQSQETEETASNYYNATIEVSIQAFFKILGEVKTVLQLRTILADMITGEVFDDLTHFDVG